MNNKKLLRSVLVATSVVVASVTVNAQTVKSATQTLQLSVNPTMNIWFDNGTSSQSLDGVTVTTADASTNHRYAYIVQTGGLYVRSNVPYHMFATANQTSITGSNNSNNTIDMNGVQLYCHFGGPISQWSFAPYSAAKSIFLYSGTDEWRAQSNNYNFGWLFDQNTVANTNSDSYTMGVTIEIDGL